MTEHHKENLSALMDGETEGLHLNQITGNETSRETWRRYHLISDAMHQRPVMVSHADMSAKISALIKDEPAILAPVTRSIPRYLKPVAGIAVAASVATVAILGVQQYQNNTVTQGQMPVAVVQTQQPVAENVALARQQPATRQPTAAVRPVQMEIQANAKINRYIINHNEYQSNVGVQGVMPHVRLVTIDANE